ncbi:MAG: hypothetical protein U9Q05_13690 [Thermodesulfobacteriota bacterium]|nr:hypothetical protein [Thermodesulfobacteriota bacterium]
MATCPQHGWQYDLETGECLNHDSPRLRKFELKIEGEDIKVPDRQWPNLPELARVRSCRGRLKFRRQCSTPYPDPSSEPIRLPPDIPAWAVLPSLLQPPAPALQR